LSKKKNEELKTNCREIKHSFEILDIFAGHLRCCLEMLLRASNQSVCKRETTSSEIKIALSSNVFLFKISIK